MPLFGFRKDKKHEQSHIQAEATLAKVMPGSKRQGEGKGVNRKSRQFKSEKPEKIGAAIVTKRALVGGKDKDRGTRAVAIPSGAFSSATEAIIRPHVTEKSGVLSQNGVYTFQVGKNANKHLVAKAVAALYKVTPVKIAMTNLPAKQVFLRGRKGMVPGMKKAIVTVKKGEKIDFV